MKLKHFFCMLMLVFFLVACKPEELGGCNSFSDEKFSESSLIGHWGGSRETAWDSTIIIREDGRYKQILCIERTGFKYESDWLPWRVTYSDQGLPYLHLEGLLMCAYWGQMDCSTGETNIEPVEVGDTGDPFTGEYYWYDYCQEEWVDTPDEGVFLLFKSGRSPRGIDLVPFTKSAGGTSGPSYEPREPWSTNLIFADGFESGDFSGWSAIINDGANEVGSVQVSPAAALMGQYGVQVTANDNTARYVRDDTPDRESLYLARFFFDPNTVVIPDGNALDIFAGHDARGESVQVFRVQLRFLQQSGYQVRGQALKGDSTYASTPWYSVDDARHTIGIYWATNVAINTRDGLFVLNIDGEPMWSGGFLHLGHNTQQIDEVRLGKVTGEGASGTLYFDAFDSGHKIVDCTSW